MKNIKIMILGLCAVMPMQASDWAKCVGAGCTAGAIAAYATTKFMHGQPLWPVSALKKEESAEVVGARIELEDEKVNQIQKLQDQVTSFEGRTLQIQALSENKKATDTALVAIQEKVEGLTSQIQTLSEDKKATDAALVALQTKVAELPTILGSQRRLLVTVPRSPGVPYPDQLGNSSDEEGKPLEEFAISSNDIVHGASLAQLSGPQRQKRHVVVPAGDTAQSSVLGSADTVQ